MYLGCGETPVHMDSGGAIGINSLHQGSKLWILFPTTTSHQLLRLGVMKLLEYTSQQDLFPLEFLICLMNENIQEQIHLWIVVQEPGQTILIPPNWAHATSGVSIFFYFSVDSFIIVVIFGCSFMGTAYS